MLAYVLRMLYCTVPGYRDGVAADPSLYGTGALGHPTGGLHHPTLSAAMGAMGGFGNRVQQRSVLNAIDDYLQRDLRTQTGQQHFMTSQRPSTAYGYATQQYDPL